MTTCIKIFDGHAHAPFFIFVRAAKCCSDLEILGHLELSHYKSCDILDGSNNSKVYFTEDDQWVHIFDDWSYSLWDKGPYRLVDKLHKYFPDKDIFAFSVGDSDHSFDFAYYSEGKVVRKFCLEDRPSNEPQRKVREDFGERLPHEKPLSEIGDEHDYLFSLASALGVKFNHKLESVRCYSEPRAWPPEIFKGFCRLFPSVFNP